MLVNFIFTRTQPYILMQQGQILPDDYIYTDQCQVNNNPDSYSLVSVAGINVNVFTHTV